MAEPFLAEVRIFSFQFAPKGWALCNGQLLPINQNQGLFSLLGTTFGGDGRVNFALPNLQARVPIHFGAGHILGEKGGETAHTVTIQEMPQHIHTVSSSQTDGDQPIPTNNILARTVNNIYQTASNLISLDPGTITNVGGSQPHENRQPFLTLSFCIALQGIFPSPN